MKAVNIEVKKRWPSNLNPKYMKYWPLKQRCGFCGKDELYYNPYEANSQGFILNIPCCKTCHANSKEILNTIRNKNHADELSYIDFDKNPD